MSTIVIVNKIDLKLSCNITRMKGGVSMRYCLPGIDGLVDIGWPGEDPRFIDDDEPEKGEKQEGLKKPF